VTRDGDPYTPPARGVFMTTNAARLAFFNERQEGFLWRVLGFYADAVGDAEIAAKWKERAATIGKRDSLLALVAEAERENVPKVLREEGNAAALAAGRRSGQAMVVSKADTDAGGLGLVPESEMPAALGRLSDRQREIAEEFGMIVGMVPSALFLATLAIRTETQLAAREHAEQLASACRAIAPSSFAPERWRLMAEIIERAYLQGWSSAQLAEWDQSLTGEKLDSFNLTMRLAACANATPIDAAAAMLAFLPRLCGCFPPGTAVHRELIMPFVVAYWTYRFQHQRFLFGRRWSWSRSCPWRSPRQRRRGLWRSCGRFTQASRSRARCRRRCGGGFTGKVARVGPTRRGVFGDAFDPLAARSPK
jgi:hypothetical protein